MRSLGHFPLGINEYILCPEGKEALWQKEVDYDRLHYHNYFQLPSAIFVRGCLICSYPRPCENAVSPYEVIDFCPTDILLGHKLWSVPHERKWWVTLPEQDLKSFKITSFACVLSLALSFSLSLSLPSCTRKACSAMDSIFSLGV